MGRELGVLVAKKLVTEIQLMGLSALEGEQTNRSRKQQSSD